MIMCDLGDSLAGYTHTRHTDCIWEERLFARGQVLEEMRWRENSQPDEPASPSPAQCGSSAARPSRRDASPAHSCPQTHELLIVCRASALLWSIWLSSQDLRSCWRERRAPPRRSSSGWSGPRSGTAARSDPSPDASCGCPAVTHTYYEDL